MAAERLRYEDPRAFGCLSTSDIPFRFCDEQGELLARRPIIEVDSEGRLRAVRVNSRSMEPPEFANSDLADFYRAYRRFVGVLNRDDARIELSLGPGDLVVFDNRRVLHGRTAYSAGAGRHLRGCYVDLFTP